MEVLSPVSVCQTSLMSLAVLQNEGPVLAVFPIAFLQYITEDQLSSGVHQARLFW